MRCFWKLLVLFAILPAFAIGCGSTSTTDNVSQETLEAEAAVDDAEEDAEEMLRNEGDESDDDDDDE